MRISSYTLILISFIFSGCYAPMMITNDIPTLPSRSLKPDPTKIVVANAYDVKTASVRNNKEKLFEELINLTVRHTSNEISRRSEILSSFKEGISVPAAQPDSSIQRLMTQQGASHAIIIKSFDSYFEQTHVDVTQTESGSKNRQAYYDIIVDIGYTLHNWSGRQFDTLITVRKFHSSRSVLSGLLAAGPNIVTNSEDAADGIYANVDMYLKSFFKGREKRIRMVLNSKELKEITSLVYASEYEKAFDLYLDAMKSTNPQVAAKAAYNCAVILERLERYNEVKYYLIESKRLYYLPEANDMLFDYRLFRVQE